MTPSEIDELDRLMTAATPGPWRDEREPPPTRNRWFETHDGAPIESRGTHFALGVAVGVTAEPRDAAAIVAFHNAAPALIAAARDLLWHEDRHGTRAEQEAEDAAVAADLARIDALSDEECKAELAAEGIDYDAARKKIDVTLKLCVERAGIRQELEQLRAFVPRWEPAPRSMELRLMLGRAELSRVCPYGDGCWYDYGDAGKDHQSAEDAGRAVCARLGIPYVPVEVSDG